MVNLLKCNFVKTWCIWCWCWVPHHAPNRIAPCKRSQFIDFGTHFCELLRSGFLFLIQTVEKEKLEKRRNILFMFNLHMENILWVSVNRNMWIVDVEQEGMLNFIAKHEKILSKHKIRFIDATNKLLFSSDSFKFTSTWINVLYRCMSAGSDADALVCLWVDFAIRHSFFFSPFVLLFRTSHFYFFSWWWCWCWYTYKLKILFIAIRCEAMRSH